MAKVLLGITGSVAAVKTLEIAELLLKTGHDVRVCCTASSLYFFPLQKLREVIGPKDESDLPPVFLDADEWSWGGGGSHYKTEQKILHIEARRWADLFLLAPLDANTLAKMADGIADNTLTCIWRAWDLAKPVILAPAMNTLMWKKRATLRNLQWIAEEFGLADSQSIHPSSFCEAINKQRGKLALLAPAEKQLACGDLGLGAMAPIQEIIREVNRLILTVPH
ncbi:MAG: phosphopantothenoylcysteine decarboxylase [Gemmataceae bacterium]|nr:phosphopantothenoylcysteine decarboxylase [Gemmataceae bacterium]